MHVGHMASRVTTCMPMEKSIKREGNQFVQEESNKRERNEKKTKKKKKKKGKKETDIPTIRTRRTKK